jgi:hypothetical protein
MDYKLIAQILTPILLFWIGWKYLKRDKKEDQPDMSNDEITNIFEKDEKKKS